MSDIPPVRLGIYSIFGLVLAWLYYNLFESSVKQATLGKLALGIAVKDIDGKRISFGRANARYWCKLLSCAILFIGYIMAGFSKKKQALHDILADTLVINERLT